ncbi:amidohydrolase family protein [Candidatus Binatus sp.]|uniref:amidohydrolase family protein n=1 Tax=Candidatus Binatus sp. TaxID=2811406 RepID=UPI003C658472
MKDGFKIADVDTHLMEPDYVFERYIDERYKSAAPRIGIAPESGRRTFLVEGEPFTREKGKYPMAAPGFLDAVRKAMKRFDRAGKLGFSPESRIMDMDEQGVDVQIVYPTAAGQMLGREFHDAQLLAACCRAYNDWSADYCSKTHDRVKWAAILPMQDVGESIKEANRAAKNGAISFYVRPNPVRGRTIFHDDYLPLWAEVEKLDRPISTHDSGSASVESFGDRMDTHVTGHILSHPFEAMAAMAGLIWYGVIEKFPKLRVVQVEADGGWVPYWLQRMEQHWDFSGNSEHEYLSKRPTEYFKSNFFVAFRGDEPTMKAALDIVGDNNFLWDTDYPHPDGTFPWGIDALLKQSIPHSSKKKILWDNATRAFNFN